MNSAIQVLNLGNDHLGGGVNQLRGPGTKAVAQALLVNRTLRSLSLRNNDIGLEGVQALAVLSAKIN